MKRFMFVLVLLASASLMAQDGQGPATPPPGGPGGQWGGGGRMKRLGPDGPGPRMKMPGPAGMPGGGKWWKNSDVVKDLGLTDTQVNQVEKTFQDHRMQLVDLRATLEKAELGLEPMMQADQPNEQQVSAQIDKIAQARAALEKSNAMMLLGVRRILTVDQWKKLQAQERPKPFPGAFRQGPKARRIPLPDGPPASQPTRPPGTDE